MIRVAELRQREVVNIIDGRRMGAIKDIELDLEAGRVNSLIVPSMTGKFLFIFGRDDDLIIPWENVVKIGVDVILVESYSCTAPLHRGKT